MIRLSAKLLLASSLDARDMARDMIDYVGTGIQSGTGPNWARVDFKTQPPSFMIFDYRKTRTEEIHYVGLNPKFGGIPDPEINDLVQDWIAAKGYRLEDLPDEEQIPGEGPDDVAKCLTLIIPRHNQ
jgi:hypothetical protein